MPALKSHFLNTKDRLSRFSYLSNWSVSKWSASLQWQTCHVRPRLRSHSGLLRIMYVGNPLVAKIIRFRPIPGSPKFYCYWKECEGCIDAPSREGVWPARLCPCLLLHFTRIGACIAKWVSHGQTARSKRQFVPDRLGAMRPTRRARLTRSTT